MGAEDTDAGAAPPGPLAAMAAQTPPRWVRALLVAEVVGYVAALLAYIWAAVPASFQGIQWHGVVFFGLAFVFPIALNLLHGDRPRDSGIRLDNLAPATKETAVVTAGMLLFVLVVGWISDGFHWISWTRLLERGGLYLGWGLIQQYLLQAFALRRLRQAGLGGITAAAAAALLFSLLHAPNWPLVLATIGSGMAWCLLFLRHPNLLPLGLAHALLGTLIYFVWPISWLRGMTIGRPYLQRAGMGL